MITHAEFLNFGVKDSLLIFIKQVISVSLIMGLTFCK